MKNYQMGIDISKEKLNICLKRGTETVREEEIPNTAAAVRKCVKRINKENGVAVDEMLACAEFTGRYIYPLVCACDELGLFLWMEDPTRIKNSFGVTRGKDDRVDARRIAEYAYRFSDKAVAYEMPDRTLVSLKNLLADRDTLAADRKKYEMQLHDQKGYMDPSDYARKKRSWAAVARTLDKQIALIDAEIQRLVESDEKIRHQKDLLKSVDGVGDRVAVYMIVVTMAFTRFETPRQFNCYAGLAPFRYTLGKSIYSKSKVSQRANKQIKALLHLAAVSASTHMKESEYKEYYRRKTGEGKHPMCVLNVVRAKLVSRMFAVIKRDEAYQRHYNISTHNEKISQKTIANS